MTIRMLSLALVGMAVARGQERKQRRICPRLLTQISLSNSGLQLRGCDSHSLKIDLRIYASFSVRPLVSVWRVCTGLFGGIKVQVTSLGSIYKFLSPFGGLGYSLIHLAPYMPKGHPLFIVHFGHLL
jgi:hypothetical protein